ncbi:MAG: hypothetical protein K2R93_20600 [Gemmatimonadaceae bacterium]|nr:hypothetical protein [Gemmatimonadaceae bacterium]
MTRRRIGRLTPASVELVALLVALVAGIVLVWPASVTVEPASRPAPVPPARPAVVSTSDSVRAQIVATNLFSGSRRAPRERFRLPGTEPAVEAPLIPELPGALAADGGPQLFGIVQVDGTPRALLQSASDSTPRLVAVGARIGAWRVQRIGTDRVDLLSSAGARTVRLSRRSSSDSVGSPP